MYRLLCILTLCSITGVTHGKVHTKQDRIAVLKEQADSLFAAYRETGMTENLSDYADVLIQLGKYQKAKKVYQRVETLSPNRYTTAFRLAGVYELTGNPDEALFWLKKAIRIDPKAHAGSEWIHQKVLEFKIKRTEDDSKSILGLDFGQDAFPKKPAHVDLVKLQRQISYQLENYLIVRVHDDRILGNIYFDLGNSLAKTNNIQRARESYEKAKKYGYQSPLLALRMQKLQAHPHNRKKKAGSRGTTDKTKKVLIEVGMTLLVLLTSFSVFLIFMALFVREIIVMRLQKNETQQPLD